jgi:hypothetical protein
MLLVLLAWSHISFATHQFEHSMRDMGNGCETCVQFDRLDDVLVPTQVASIERTEAPERAPANKHATDSRKFSYYLSRASP